VKIRNAVLSDIQAIHQLSSALGYENVPIETANEQLNAVLGAVSNKIYVAELNNVVVGWLHVFIALRVASPSFIEIGGLVVSPGYRRIGVGEELILQAKHWAFEEKMKLRVRCTTAREETHKFYQAAGFIKSKEQYVFEIDREQLVRVSAIDPPERL
jgi:N-acetylglutamate synthase-like GNAT family acetyltransferase